MNRESERKRLTTDKKKIFVRECPTIMSVTKAELHKLYIEIFDRLQEYEVAEETGQIIVPPVKVGEKLYTTYCYGINDWRIEESVVYEVRQRIGTGLEIFEMRRSENGTFSYFKVELDKFGKTVFTSREDAVKALEGEDK